MLVVSQSRACSSANPRRLINHPAVQRASPFVSGPPPHSWVLGTYLGAQVLVFVIGVIVVGADGARSASFLAAGFLTPRCWEVLS